jgi:hypothetical protein
MTAAFETRCFLFLSTFLQHHERMDKALAYAWDTRIYPIFHRSLEREHHGGTDCHAAVYAVKEDFIDKLSKYLDNKWLAAKQGAKLEGVAFYDLEDKFGGRAVRSALIHCIRYFWLQDAFDEELYKAIEAHAPMEAHGLTSEFGPDDVSLE